MIKNHLLFPIYERLQRQFRFAKNFGDHEINTFLFPNFIIPSFYFTREKGPYGIGPGNFRVLDKDGNQVLIVYGGVNVDGNPELTQESRPNYDDIGYRYGVLKTIDYPNSNLYGAKVVTLPCGLYYINLQELDREDVVAGQYYSELFNIVDAVPITDGIELIKNGNFDADLNSWETSGTWSWLSGTAFYTGGGTAPILKQFIGNDKGIYRVKVSITGVTNAGGLRAIAVNTDSVGGTNRYIITDSGEYEFYVDRLTSFELTSFIDSGEMNFEIDNISVQRVIGYENYVSIVTARTCQYPNQQ